MCPSGRTSPPAPQGAPSFQGAFSLQAPLPAKPVPPGTPAFASPQLRGRNHARPPAAAAAHRRRVWEDLVPPCHAALPRFFPGSTSSVPCTQAAPAPGLDSHPSRFFPWLMTAACRRSHLWWQTGASPDDKRCTKRSTQAPRTPSEQCCVTDPALLGVTNKTEALSPPALVGTGQFGVHSCSCTCSGKQVN